MSTPEEDQATVGTLLWEESRRQLVRQESDLDSLRLRAAGILSVAALVAGLLGPHVQLANHGWRAVPLGFALGFFAIGALCSVVALAPRRKRWTFAHNMQTWFTDLKDGNLRPIDLTANLAEHFEGYRLSNVPEIQRLYDWFLLSCVFVGLQVIAWGVALA